MMLESECEILFIARVLTISHENNSLLEHVISDSAPTYCSPHTKFWLTDDGLEDPDVELIRLTFKRISKFGWQPITFCWDNGKYVGLLAVLDTNLRWANGAHCCGTITNISTL